MKPSGGRPRADSEPSFKQKIVVITGGAGGLGRAFSLEFCRLGADVVCGDLSAKAGAQLMKASKSLAGRIHFIECDMGTAQACIDLAGAAEALGGVDVLCNNVGIQPAASYVPAHELSEDLWDAIIRVNLTSYFLMIKHCYHLFLRRKGGVVINTASVQGLQSQKGAAAYAASKGAIISLTRQLALEYAEKNIRVLAIAPGTFDTPLLREVMKGIPDKAYAQRLVNAYPMKRFGKPEELAKVVAFLASSGSSFMTGECVTVDGGIMARGGWAQ